MSSIAPCISVKSAYHHKSSEMCLNSVHKNVSMYASGDIKMDQVLLVFLMHIISKLKNR